MGNFQKKKKNTIEKIVENLYTFLKYSNLHVRFLKWSSKSFINFYKFFLPKIEKNTFDQCEAFLLKVATFFLTLVGRTEGIYTQQANIMKLIVINHLMLCTCVRKRETYYRRIISHKRDKDCTWFGKTLYVYDKKAMTHIFTLFRV